MRIKKCEYCGKYIPIPRESWLKHAYKRFRKYHKVCAKKAAKEHHEQNYKRRTKLTKTDHNKYVLLINKEIKGEVILNQTYSGRINPDIIKGNNYYEVEMFLGYDRLKKRRDLCKKKKYILYVVVPKKIRDLFDEVKFFKN